MGIKKETFVGFYVEGCEVQRVQVVKFLALPYFSTAVTDFHRYSFEPYVLIPVFSP